MTHSSFLQPQVLINDPLKELKKKPFFISQEKVVQSQLNSNIPDGWDSFIHSVKKKDLNINDSQQKEIQNFATYRWTLENNRINIFFIGENQLTEKDFQISTTTIESKVISGEFLYPILNYQVKNEDNKLSIEINLDQSKSEFNSDDNWPVIISGGDNADLYSSYLLADLSMRLGENDFFFYWGLKSASKGCPLAQKALGLIYLHSMNDFNNSIYWFTILSLNNKDEFARTVISQFLFESNDENCDPNLSENILIGLANDGVKEAFYYLGYLHLQKIDNWVNDENLAVKYLEEGAKLGDKPSMKLLSECYTNGVGCEKDMEKARYYSTLGDDDEKDENIENNEKDKETENIKKEDKDDDHGFPIASLVISTVAIVGTALMGSYIFRRIFRK